MNISYCTLNTSHPIWNTSTQEQKLHLGVLLENMFKSGSERAGDGEVQPYQVAQLDVYSLWLVFDRDLGVTPY